MRTKRKFTCIILIFLTYHVFAQNCTSESESATHYLTSINCFQDFHLLSKINHRQNLIVPSIKVVYEFDNQRLYFVNSNTYDLHFDFCKYRLLYSGTHSEFNESQYKENSRRVFYNLTLNYISDLDIFAISFADKDQIPQNKYSEIYNQLQKQALFKNKLYFLIPSSSKKNLSAYDLPIISREELFNKNFEALNTGIAYGYLRVYSTQNIHEAKQNEIIILTDNSLDVPIISGLITTQFQPPLSHLNILSKNRGTPNMQLTNALDRKLLKKHINKLVKLEVKNEAFKIEEIEFEEASIFWNSKKKTTFHLTYNDSFQEIVRQSDTSCINPEIIGSKASNFFKLSQVINTIDDVFVPEYAFAIPFYFYNEHIHNNDIDSLIEHISNDSLSIHNDSIKSILNTIQQQINHSPLNPKLIEMVTNQIEKFNIGNIPFRYRSSSNAEDIEGFNGAGLYTSKTGITNDSNKPIEKAIKEVWASLWSYKAFAERAYFGINQKTVRMGILVHRSFPSETANGVAITSNIFNTSKDGIYINVQANDISIVLPTTNQTCDAILYSTQKRKKRIKYLERSNVIPEETTVMTNVEIDILCKTLLIVREHFHSQEQSNLPIEKYALDIEFKIDNGKIYLKQFRKFPLK